MCGICGAINTAYRIVTEDQVGAMVNAQRHRGPDDSGVVTDGRVILGHSRLSIIDLAGGTQPMPSHDGRLWTVFNGEIFNFVELRELLRNQGALFRTGSDTEVILEAYREWGTDCFAKFNGQWALALWDRQLRRLILCRDRVGIRPLFHTRVRGAWLFASEIKALFCHPGVARELDPEGVAETFTLWSPVPPRTVFRGVNQLPPGMFMTIDLEGAEARTDTYWSPEFGQQAEIRHATLQENAERLRSTLIDAARLRFDRSDVPVGAYLSGGVDSTIIAAVLSRYTNTVLETFSVRFDDPEFDESGYQTLAARTLNVRNRSVVAREDQISREFSSIVWHAEQPLLRTAPGPLFLLSRLVRDHGMKVVVTGEGADEVLAGYDLFREAAVRREIATCPHCARNDELVSQLYPWMSRSPARARRYGTAFFNQSSDVDDPAFSHRPRWKNGTALLRLLAADFPTPTVPDVVQTLVDSLPRQFERWDPLERAQYLELRTLLPGYILSAQGDRMLMAHSVEGRFPFLDHRIIELAGSLPPEQKLDGLQEKRVLKLAFADLIPAAIAGRSKQPYRAPDAACFVPGGAVAPWIRELLSQQSVREAGIFNPVAINGLLEKCAARGGRVMSNSDNMCITAVVSTMILHNSFLRTAGRTPVEFVRDSDVPVRQLDRGGAVCNYMRC